MDIRSLNATEKEAVVRAMVFVARIDGRLSPEESSFMQTMALREAQGAGTPSQK